MKNFSQPCFFLRVAVLVTVVLFTGLFTGQANAAAIRIAVATQFDFTLEELKQEFENNTGHSVVFEPGPSALLLGRILKGESFDIFLADDARRPQFLESENRIVPGSRFTYSRGRLVLWSLRNRALGPSVLRDGDFRLLALTDPMLSPFGRAAQESLEALDAWDSLQDKIVMGNNIGQTYNFAISGDAEMALIPLSQIIYGKYMQAGNYWVVPDTLYTPIEHQAVQLSDNPAATEFMDFLRSEAGRGIIRGNGFNAP